MEREYSRLERRLDRLESWQRDVAGAWRDIETFIETYEPVIEAMMKADEFAEMLKENTAAQRKNAAAHSQLRLSTAQAWIAGIGLLLLVGGFIVTLIQLATHG